MNKKLSLSLAVALLLSLASCDQEPLKPAPKPEPPSPVVPAPSPSPEEPKPEPKPEPKAFDAGDFKEDMLKDGVLTLPEHFISITPASLDAHKAQIKIINAPGVTEIADNAFTAWEMLTAVDFPKATKVGNKAFEGCNGISKIEFPEVTEIGEESFLYCAGLKTLALPKVSKVGNKAFVQCHNLTKVELPMLTELGNEAFADCLSLSEVSLPELKKLGDKVFHEVYSLRKIIFGATMPEIADGATPFLNTSVAKELYVPEGSEANFVDWANTTRFISLNGDKGRLTQNFDDTNKLTSQGFSITSGTLTRMEESEVLELSNFVLTPGVTTIGEGIFNGLENDEDELGGFFSAYGVTKVESGAFRHCGFERIELPNATDIATGVFAESSVKVVVLPKLQYLKETILERTGINILHLPSVTKIDKHALTGCKDLKYLILGATPPQIPPLKDINKPLNNSIFGLDTGGNAVKSAQVTIVVPDGSEAQYATWVGKNTQIKGIIPLSKFRK